MTNKILIKVGFGWGDKENKKAVWHRFVLDESEGNIYCFSYRSNRSFNHLHLNTGYEFNSL